MEGMTMNNPKHKTSSGDERAFIVKALQKMLEILLAHSEADFDDVMSNGIWQLAEAIDLDRVAVFRYIDFNGEMRLRQMYRWDKAEGGTTSVITGANELPQNKTIASWMGILSKNGYINTRISDLSGGERTFMSLFGIKAILVIPIFTHNKFWGIITLQDLYNDRLFNEDHIDLMCSASHLIANAIIRAEMTRNADDAIKELERREIIRSTLNEMALVFLSQNEATFKERMTVGMGLIVDKIRLDRVSVWRNSETPHGLLTSQIYCWEREGGGTVSPRPELQNVPVDQFTSSWKKILSGEIVLNGPVRLMNDPPAAFRRYGIVSAFLTPLYFDSEYWGFVIFEDMHYERFFDDDEIMRMAAFLCANAVIRDEMEREIKDALQQATAASKAKGEFLSNMSHEIRTPLNAIIGMTSIAESTDKTERKNYAIEKIKVASKHLLGSINDILDVSKIEAGKFELSPVEFNFEKILQRVVTVTNFKVIEKKQKLMVHIEKAIPRIMFGDEQRLAQVIANLLGNAVKFTPENGTIDINASFEGERDGICTIKIEVTDSGIGISREQQEKLFKPFQQAESSTSRKFGGTGLGLTISRSIVEMMGGRIWVESELGKGTTFVFTIQLQRVDDKTYKVPDWGGLRILAVDDDYVILDYFKKISERCGAVFDAVSSGGDALRLIEKNGPYGIYFIDFYMPDMNGMELTRILKERKDENAYVVMISGSEWGTIEAEAKNTGVDKFILKPLFPSNIVDSVNEFLGTGMTKELIAQSKPVDRFEGRRILLVEDVDINREIIITMLEPTLLEIESAENGRIAVEMFSGTPEKYDAIFMDVQMPEMDGYEATQTIRALDIPNAGNIPIIAMTANVFREDIEKCLEVGMNDHIGKPINIDEVLEMLRKYLPC
jgi:signal transduction histidine kinase/DNA-binding response OmpR family regulator